MPHSMSFSFKNQQTTNCSNRLCCILTHHHQYQSPPSSPAPSCLQSMLTPQVEMSQLLRFNTNTRLKTWLMNFLYPNKTKKWKNNVELQLLMYKSTFEPLLQLTGNQSQVSASNNYQCVCSKSLQSEPQSPTQWALTAAHDPTPPLNPLSFLSSSICR